jgi:hypothetical protein
VLARPKKGAAVIRRHDEGLVRAVAGDVKRLVTNFGVDHFLPGARLGKWDGDDACAVGKIQEDHDELFGGVFRDFVQLVNSVDLLHFFRAGVDDGAFLAGNEVAEQFLMAGD